MNSKRIQTHKRFSAVTIFRAWRKHLGARQAYWLAVVRYGWKPAAQLAWDRLSPLARRICSQP